MELLTEALALSPFVGVILLFLIATVNFLLKREFDRFEKRMDLFDKALFGDKEDIANSPGIIRQVKGVSDKQDQLTESLKELKNALRPEGGAVIMSLEKSEDSSPQASSYKDIRKS